MKKLLFALAVSLLPMLALGDTTWAEVATGLKSVKATCTSGSEAPGIPENTASGAYVAATEYAQNAVVIYGGVPYVSLQGTNTGHTPSTSSAWWRAVGVPIYNVTALKVTVCTTFGKTITGGSAVVYVWDPAIGLWEKFTSYTLPTGQRCVLVNGDSPALGIPIVFRGSGIRVAVGLASATTSSGTDFVVYHRIMNASGGLL